ncbi:MAG: adenylate cyclase [Fibrobacteres bacterium]|nr:adenylate cyclase [Fibrobacterota bacterium]
MTKIELYEILKDTVKELNRESDLFSPLPPAFTQGASLDSLGLDPLLLPDILQRMKSRFGGRDLSGCLDALASLKTIDDLLGALSRTLGHGISVPTLVYVDDEEANLFVFKRRFDKHFKVKYFDDPAIALEFILNDPTVALVLTDEVMPLITGNQLCDRVHALKPALKFILLTGNPNNQDDLLYQTMRQNRFFDFLQKPLDFENKFEELKRLFASILETEGKPK